MKKNTQKKQYVNVIKATRSAVVTLADKMDILKQNTAEFARKAESRWEETKPKQEQAKAELKKAAKEMMEFKKAVQQGIKEGLAEVEKKNKNKKK